MPYVFIGLGAAALVAFCILRDKRSSVAAIAVKTLTSVLFVFTGVTAMACHPISGSWIITPAMLVIAGLVLGLVGDVTLDLKIYMKGLPYAGAKKDSDRLTYVGMAAFGVGHVFYITSSALLNGASLNLLWSAMIAMALVAGIFCLSIFVMKMQFGKFLVPSILYAFLLCWFVVLSIWQTATNGVTANKLLLVGAIMFIVSDLILSMTYFSKPEDYKREGMLNPESKTMIVANHFTYYLAQFLIAIAIVTF